MLKVYISQNPILLESDEPCFQQDNITFFIDGTLYSKAPLNFTRPVRYARFTHKSLMVKTAEKPISIISLQVLS